MTCSHSSFGYHPPAPEAILPFDSDIELSSKMALKLT